MGNSIPYIHVGEYCHPQSIITGGIHARENVTSLLVVRQAFRAAFKRCGFEGGIYFVPMVNPDGALLLEKGSCAMGGRAEFLCKINGGEDFSLWKANAAGVDLNNNFDALFGQGVGQVKDPAPQGYAGPHAFSEPETKALRSFTVSVAPRITVSYHAMGRELYWYFFQEGEERERDLRIAKRLEAATGYVRVDSDCGSSGGYKDWCIQNLRIPSFTIEIIGGCGKKHPIDCCDLDGDWEANKNVPYIVADAAGEV